MKYQYVAIEREYGSGGTGIGKQLAQSCGMAYYGAEILEEVARKLNTTTDRIEQYEESSTGSLLYSLIMMGRMESGNGNFLAGEDYIYLQEETVIRDLAMGGPAVFMGHCAAKALDNHPRVLKVFIYGDPADKKRRTVEEYGISADEAEAVMRKFDRKRSNYYYSNTRQRWTDFRNYHLVLDSSRLGTDGCLEVLKNILR